MNHYEEGEAPAESVFTVQGHYRQDFYSAKILLWNSSDNGDNSCKSVVRRRFRSWTLAIPLLFSSDLDKFKLETQIKTFKNIADEKKAGIKEAIKIILSLNASQVLKLVKLILLAPTTNAVTKKSRSMLRRVKTYLRSSRTQEPPV